MKRRRYGRRYKRRRSAPNYRRYKRRKTWPGIRLGGRTRSLLISIFLTVLLSMVWHGPALYDYVADGGLGWPSGIRTITYAAEVPHGADDRVARAALDTAVSMWDDLNQDLEFKKVNDRPMTRVVFSDSPVIGAESYYHGLATCQSTWSSIFEGDRCVIEVYIPNTGRNKDVLTTVIMHEFGHVLGLGHTLNPSHLMFTNEGPDDEFLVEPFDNLGYKVPPPIP